MGIYLPNMEMPTDKAVGVVIHPDGTAYTAEMFAGVCTKYLADCTAVPVPPHGDLIDRDALIRNHAIDKYNCSEVISMEDIRNAPTVIKAEEGDGW